MGRKFELDLEGGERAVVVVHHDGKRELFVRPSPDADSERLLTLSGRQARRLGAILEGAYFQPVDLDSVDVPLGEAIIEWVTVGEDSPLVGRTLGEANVRGETGVSILAVQRDEETHANPDSAFELRVGDILVALGTREEHGPLATLVGGESGDREPTER